MSGKLGNNSKKIAFVHPDLGIGGAERLVVDAAVGLQELENEVTIYTSHCDRKHCFEEVSSNLLNVEVYGDFFPSSVLKRFHILFAIIRQFYLVLALIFTGKIKQYDYFIVDQLSFCIPLLCCFSRPDCKILFYCHFPDQLLALKGGFLKRFYRMPFDLIEEWSTGISDQIVVNSKFTKGIFHKTFKGLKNIEPGVIYPCVDLNSATDTEEDKLMDKEVNEFFKDGDFFLSINRFERKKNIDLAIKSFAKFKAQLPKNISENNKIKPRLVVAGGFDPRVLENVEYLQELNGLSELLNLKCFTIRGKLLIIPPATDILFLPSIKTSLKKSLIKNAELLLYTPSFEHFGIVPVESMLFKTPVLSANNGGPLESIVHFNYDNIATATGYSQEPNDELWSKTMHTFYTELDEATKLKLGENGLTRVHELFLRQQMSEAFMQNLIQSNSKDEEKGILYGILKMWRIELLFVLISYYLVRLYK